MLTRLEERVQAMKTTRKMTMRRMEISQTRKPQKPGRWVRTSLKGDRHD
jgi:hypothetical protein